MTGKEAIENIGELLQDKKDESPEHAALAAEFEKYKFQWEMEMQQLEVEQLRIELADVQNARRREIEFMKANGGKRDWLMGVAVGVALIMYVAAWIFLAYGPIVPAEKKDMFNMAAGQVFTFAGMVFSYYLGTTRNSRLKDEALSKR